MSLQSHYDRRRPINATDLRSIIAAIAAAAVFSPVVLTSCRYALGLATMPRPLAKVLHHLPTIFPIHMTASALALLLVPLAFASRHHRMIHRFCGRLAALAITVGGLSSLIVALNSVATPVARSGFFAQGLVWLTLTVAAIVAIRRGQRRRHACLMTAAAMVTISPVLLRVFLNLSLSTRLPFDRVYACLAWCVWLVPLLVLWLLLLRETTCARLGVQLVGIVQSARPTAWKPSSNG